MKMTEPIGSFATSWKTAPKMAQLAAYYDIFDILRAKSLVAKLSHQLFVKALLDEHYSENGACLFGPAKADLDGLGEQCQRQGQVFDLQVQGCHRRP